MNKTQKKLVTLSTILAIGFGIYPAANAMHIMEGYLPVTYCIAWGILCIPFLIAGFFSLKKTIQEHRKTLILLAMAGAYAFVLSALKIPSVTGSSSHMTGTGLGAILFGPCATRNFRTDRPPISGSTSRSRRSYDTWSKYIFHGNRRSASDIWNL